MDDVGGVDGGVPQVSRGLRVSLALLGLGWVVGVVQTLAVVSLW